MSPSQEIYGALLRLREEKKVVVSMGTLAASGAYYVACAADKIVANAGTITGSIGVKINHVNMSELVRLSRVEPKVLASGPYKNMGSPLKPLSKEDEALFKKMISQMFEQFKEVVAKQRNLSADKLAIVTDGRVFTGQEALERGLVDSLGSLQDAIDVAAELAEIEGKPKVVYPEGPPEHWLRYFIHEAMATVRIGMAEAVGEPLVLWRM